MAKRIYAELKMGKPRGLNPETETVISKAGRVFKVCRESSDILCRSFGFTNITKGNRQIDNGIIEGVIDDGISD